MEIKENEVDLRYVKVSDKDMQTIKNEHRKLLNDVNNAITTSEKPILIGSLFESRIRNFLAENYNQYTLPMAYNYLGETMGIMMLRYSKKYDPEKNETVEVPPKWYTSIKEKSAKEPGKPYLLIFDGIDDILDAASLCTFLETIVLNKLDEFPLPPNVKIVCTFNRECIRPEFKEIIETYSKNNYFFTTVTEKSPKFEEVLIEEHKLDCEKREKEYEERMKKLAAERKNNPPGTRHR